MDDDAQIFSVIGGAKRSGRWRVPASTRTLTLFGRCLIDLRQAETTADELSFSCISAFAGVTFIVPEGAEVRPSGVAVLGSARSLVPVSDTPAHLPPISIDAITVLGRLRIRTTDEEPEEELRDSWRERRRARKATKKAEKKAEKASQAAPAAVAVSATGPVDDEVDTGSHRDRRPATDSERILVDADDLRRSARPPRDEADSRVDLSPVERHETDRELVDLKPIERRPTEPAADTELVDLKPVARRPSISAPTTLGDDTTDDVDAPDLFDRPRDTATTVDPVPVGSIDDHPTTFAADDQSPLEGLRVPDDADALTATADVTAGTAAEADEDDDPWGDEEDDPWA